MPAVNQYTLSHSVFRAPGDLRSDLDDRRYLSSRSSGHPRYHLLLDINSPAYDDTQIRGECI